MWVKTRDKIFINTTGIVEIHVERDEVNNNFSVVGLRDYDSLLHKYNKVIFDSYKEYYRARDVAERICQLSGLLFETPGDEGLF